MNWKEIITDKDFQFNRISTLILLLVATSLTLMTVVIPFIQPYFPQPLVHAFLFVIFDAFIIGVWYYHRAVFPKGNAKKLNLIIAITTEDKTQKTRITKDFSKEIVKQLRLNGLSDSYEVIVLHNHLSKILHKKIHLSSEAERANMTDAEDIKAFERIRKRLNAKFFVYGDLIKRNSAKSTYSLSIEALLIHSSANQINNQTLQKEFSDQWKREITFLEDDELNGFKSNAEQVFFTASYMLGLATLVDNRFKEGIKIWDALIKYAENDEELKSYKAKMIQLKGICYFLLARLFYLQGKIEESLIYRKRLLEIIPNKYDEHLIEAIKQVKLRNDPELAMQHVERAKLLANGDGTWKYSTLYLKIQLDRCDEAIEMLDDIIKTTFHNEIDTIHQVIAYNKQCLIEDPSHILSHFIIGVLVYKKLNQPLNSYEMLEAFLYSTPLNEKMSPLKERTAIYISEINELLKIKR